MNFYTKKKRAPQFALAISILVLIIVGAIAYRDVVLARRSQDSVDHTYQVTVAIERLNSETEAFKLALDRYVVTGDEVYVGTFRARVQDAERERDTFAFLTLDNPAQQAKLSELDRLITEKRKISDTIIRARQTGGLAAAVLAFQHHAPYIKKEPLQQMLYALRDEERRLFELRKADTAHRERETKFFLTLTTCLGLMIALTSGWHVGRESFIRERSERLLIEGLLEAAPDPMVVVNELGAIVLLNAQVDSAFGYRREELVGQPVSKILPVGFGELLAVGAILEGPEGLSTLPGAAAELFGIRKDGSRFPIEMVLSPLESSGQRLVTAAIRDITLRKQVDVLLQERMAELKRSNEELEQFAYVASHDLQEPLRMVASYTQLLSRRYKGKLDSDADEFIAYAVDGANRMQRMILDLLSYSRVGSAGRAFAKTPSEECLLEALDNLGGVIEDSGAVVTHDRLPVVMADEVQITQLFQNLVGNGIKYRDKTADVPRIHISAAKDGGKKWIFSVRDNGLGIDPQYFDRIFGMFRRLHRREEFAGTGIGLAICKKIVERHGGTIWVESQPGDGSTFSFVLAGESKSC